MSLLDIPRDRAAQKQALIATRMNEARIARDISRIVGDQNARRLSDTTTAHRSLEVAPRSAEEVTQVMRLASNEHLSVIPAGAATWIDAGNVLNGSDLILTTRRMTRVISHEPADLVATAEAGATLSEFQKHLAHAGQWLPIDPPDDAENGRATLGGVVATGLGGTHSVGFGLPRSFVIGMRLVLADGRAIKAGGNVVKNVAGYDLCKLFTGSYGTLGLITELTFKLRPLPAESRTVVASGTLASLITAGRKVASQFSPVAIELISRRLAEGLEVGTGRDLLLMVRFMGSPRSVVAQTAQALKVLREANNQCTTHDDDDALWRKLSAVPFRSEGELIWRVGLRPTDLISFLGDVTDLENDEASHAALRWHAGLGDGRLRAIARAPVYHRETVRVLERLRQKTRSLGGNLVLESAPAEIKNEFDAWGDFGSVTGLMKRVKAQLDPNNMLSPGRFDAGI